MKDIKLRITLTYNFVKGKDCTGCHLIDYCNELNDLDCEEGTMGHYECDEEELEQLDDLNGFKN